MKDGIIALGTIIDATLKQAFEGPLRFLRDGLQYVMDQAVVKTDMLNPFSERRKDIATAEQKMAQAKEKLTGSQSFKMMTGGMGGPVTIAGTAAATDPKVIKGLTNAIDFYQTQIDELSKGTGFAAVQAQNANQSLLTSGESYTEAVARGTEALAKAIKGAASSAADSITAIGTKDFTGATEASKQAADAAEKLRKRGAAINDAAIAQPPVAAGGFFGENTAGYARMRGFGSFNANAINPLARGAFGQTPLLSLADRRAKEDARVAAGGIRQASSRMAYGAVRTGDRARKKNAEIERLKKEETVGRSNELLTDIKTATQKIAADEGLD
jgi:hypothetical protein